MSRYVDHALRLELTRDERAAQDWVSSLRSHVLNDMAAGMRARFDRDVAAKLPADATPRDVLKAMRPHPYFRFYSATRVKAQELTWDTVRPALERDRARLAAVAAAVSGKAGGTLTLDPALPIPRNVAALDVHLMPGGYHQDGGEGDVAAGALYENGLSVFSFGLMGETLDDIGRSIALWLTLRFPDFKPADVLDLGCSVGHQTLPWARAYPTAEVTGIDVAPGCLRYAHARAEDMGVRAHFRQADATALPFADGSVDLVFSSMFLHELPAKDIARVFAEGARVLRPGGLMLHYELPPNAALSAYDGFYLDWDSDFNMEPYYRGYRDMDPAVLCAAAGLRDHFQAAVPSRGWYGEAAVRGAVGAEGASAGDKLGRLSDGVTWFTYGAWKR